MRRLAVAAGVLALLALVVGALALRRPPGAKRQKNDHPNVLIVLWDTVRADHLSVYGHDVDTTPFLKELAAESVVYENAVSPGMWTVPSHGSMFTGLPPSTHGATFEWRWLDHHHTTLAEHFKSNGYETFAFSANPNLSKRGANLLQGFDVVQTSWGRMWWPLVRAFTKKKLLPADASTEISPAFPEDRPGNAYYNGAPATARALFRYLDRTSTGAPWLAYLNYMEAHKPRVPHIEHRRAVMDDATQQLALKTDVSFVQQLAYDYRAREYSEAELEAARGVYDAALHELDMWTNRLFTNLEKRGILDDTIVVLTSDHGESLGEHHRFGHRYGLKQTLLHVPLLIRYPRELAPARVSHPVSTQDLFATLTDLADLPPAPSAKYSHSLRGPAPTSLFSEVLTFDHAGLDLVRRSFPQIPADGWDHTFRAVREGSMKLIVDDSDHPEMFDLETDPHELSDLSEQRPEDLERLRQRMEEHWRSIPPYDPSLRTDRDRPFVVTTKEKDMLEVLGYVVDDDDGEPAGRRDLQGADPPPDDGEAPEDAPEAAP